MKKASIFSVILAGGASSRLFPFNKILSDLTGTGRTLIQQAQERARAIAPRSQPYVLAVKELVAPIQRQLKLPKENFFVDPVRRGTWPALLWAMAHLRRSDPDAVLAVLTGDQIIPRLPAFKRAALKACHLAQSRSSIVMLGVAPGPDAAVWTGFGVFRVAGDQVTAFSEKPSLAQARDMIREGGWEWNSGMFFFRISTAEKALARFQPVMHALYETMCDAVARRQTGRAQRLYAEFPAKIAHPLDPSRLVDNSIDFAIMMPLMKNFDVSALAVTGGLPQWTDLGQWEALRDNVRPDKRKNILVGAVKADSTTRNCILAADRGFSLEVKGLEAAAIAVSDRGLLLLPRQELSQIKEHVAQAPAKKFLVVNALPQVRVKRSGRRVVVSGAAFIG